MRRALILWLGSLIFVSISVAQESVRLILPIRYLTREALYVAAGAADGLRVGDALAVTRAGKTILQLEVKFVSEHSASCLLENVSEAIRAEDKAVWSIPRAEFLRRTQPAKPPAEKINGATDPKKTPPKPAPSAPPSKPRRRATRNNAISGQISFQSLLQRDKSARQVDFLEPSAYLRLRVDRLAGMPLQFGLRLRTRQSYRTNPANDQLQRREAINRLYEMSLAYSPADGPVEFSAGRILRNDVRGLGYLDGISAAYRIGESLKVGIFGGSEPELYRSAFRFREKKLGGFVSFKQTLGAGEFSTTLSGIGRYNQQQLSREFFALQSNFFLSRRFYLSQYLEMDVNRDWRREMEGSSLTFSDFFVNATYALRPSISLHASYDARKSVRTWENHSVVDSLFDSAMRRGVHLGADVQPMPTLRISLNGGLRTASGSENIYSASLAIMQSNLLESGLSINGRMSYYGSSLSRGYYPSADLSWRLLHRLQCSLSAGAYIYASGQPARRRTNPWERARLDFNLSRALYFSGTFENFHGDSMEFIRAFLDMGLRF